MIFSRSIHVIASDNTSFFCGWVIFHCVCIYVYTYTTSLTFQLLMGTGLFPCLVCLVAQLCQTLATPRTAAWKVSLSIKEKYKFFNYFHCAQFFFRSGRHHPIFPNVKGSQDNEHPLTIRKDWETMRRGVRLSETPVCSLENGCLFQLSHPRLCEWTSLLHSEDTSRLICLTNEERCEALRVTGASDVVAVFINHSRCSRDNARLTRGASVSTGKAEEFR